jgi:hypothetical protein
VFFQKSASRILGLLFLVPLEPPVSGIKPQRAFSSKSHLAPTSILFLRTTLFVRSLSPPLLEEETYTLFLVLGWKYKNGYERGMNVTEMEKQERKNKHTIYKYLNLAYLSPKVAGTVMDSKAPPRINLQTLFGIASKYEDFGKQERAFFGR